MSGNTLMRGGPGYAQIVPPCSRSTSRSSVNKRWPALRNEGGDGRLAKGAAPEECDAFSLDFDNRRVQRFEMLVDQGERERLAKHVDLK